MMVTSYPDRGRPLVSLSLSLSDPAAHQCSKEKDEARAAEPDEHRLDGDVLPFGADPVVEEVIYLIHILLTSFLFPPLC